MTRNWGLKFVEMDASGEEQFKDMVICVSFSEVSRIQEALDIEKKWPSKGRQNLCLKADLTQRWRFGGLDGRL